MDANTLARASEPFLTAKGVDEDPGARLSMVDGLAAPYGAAVRVENRRGDTTDIRRSWLPAVAGADALADEAEVGNVACGPPAVGAARPRFVLVVDDDALVLAGTAAMLEDLGHHVAEAASGREALAILRSPKPFDLVVTDFSMPGMTGIEFALAARKLRPGLPIILATGFADLRGAADPGLPRLAKPYGQEDMEARIAEAMGEEGAATKAVPPGAARGA